MRRTLPLALGPDFDRWMAEDKGLAPSTRKTRIQRAAHADAFMRATFGRPLIQAQPDHVRAFLAPYGPKTRNSYLGDLRCFFLFARETKRRAKDPTRDIRRHKEPSYLPRPLQPEHARRLFRASFTISLRHRLIIGVALYLGLRRFEIATLRWPDIDLQESRLRLIGKGSKERVVPIPVPLLPLLQLWRIAETSTDGWVFPSQRGGHLQPASIWRHIKEAGVAARVTVTPHQLRHSYASELVDVGVDIRHIQELLGHASLASTQIYTRVSPGHLIDDVNRLDFE